MPVAVSALRIEITENGVGYLARTRCCNALLFGGPVSDLGAPPPSEAMAHYDRLARDPDVMLALEPMLAVARHCS